ncbi:carboxypeptidase B-like [Mytilus trossulus]|uniref:carboxypeptidase B-like n=1 Tax=Mytilus trossulus TaxID=6551 RepID=UPI003006A883
MDQIWNNVMQLSNRPTILVDGGIHAREWISLAAVLNFINFLQTNTAAVNLIDELQWFVIPVLDPDGYVYTYTTDSLMRKNRKQSQVNSNCFGTDLNCNYGYQWDPLESASNDPYSLVYHGPTPFSEKESIGLRDAMLQQGQTYTSYIIFQSYGLFYLYPWLHTDQQTTDWIYLDACAKAATAVINGKDMFGFINISTLASLISLLLTKCSSGVLNYNPGTFDRCYGIKKTNNLLPIYTGILHS